MLTDRLARITSTLTLLVCGLLVTSGCGPNAFERYRVEGLVNLEEEEYAAARSAFLTAHHLVPAHAENLCDLASSHMGSARQALIRDDRRAANRQIDAACNYYDRALKSFPGCRRAVAGKNEALELRGFSAEALETAEWASRMLGPAARDQLFLASEYRERSDLDRALLAYRQAVAMEPNNPTPHWALGFFYLDLDKREDAITHLQQAYQLDPSQSFVADKLRSLGAELPEVPDQERRG